MGSHLALVHLDSLPSLTVHWNQPDTQSCQHAEQKHIELVACGETRDARATPLCYADEDWLLSARIVMPSGLKNVQHGLSWP
mmetsp:Transcript_98458/g.298847  ORF Transcript_98458/g.298847 Transcript_98458/m.298847 type:complete len:82 (-) Transcript_98458:29-274(-)